MDGSSPPPSDNLFVSNLPEGIEDDMLKAVFGQYGTVVQCKVLPNLKSGHCSGLIRFSSVEEATWICENLPGTIPQGLAEVVQVRYANTPGHDKGGKGGAGGGDDRSSPYGGGASGGWAPPACHFFKKGTCMKGEDCKFSHDPGILDQDKSNGWEVAPGFSRAPGFGKGGPGPTAAAMLGASTPMKGGFGKGGAGYEGGYDAKGGGKGFGKGSGGGKGGKGDGKNQVSIGMVVQGLFKSGCLPGGESYSNDDKTLCIKGLPFDTDDFALYQIFSPFGAIAPRGIRAMLNPDGTCRGIGFINFLEEQAAASAIATLNGCQLPDGGVLGVEVKREGKGKGKSKNKDGGFKTEEQTMAELEAALAAGDLDTLTALGLGDAFGLQA